MTAARGLDKDRFRGALLGLAAGDAVGTTVEFKPPGTFPPVTDMTGGGPFALPRGAWTDDTSMALCLTESLVDQGVFDPTGHTWSDKPLHPKVLAVAQGSFHSKEPPAIRGGGYIVDALEAALWAQRSTRTFEDGVLAATNLGDDADTTAAIFGQLAGALYGIDAIPARWVDAIVERHEILALADGLYALSRA
jgi:ADP-ribosylglycohydrolase